MTQNYEKVREVTQRNLNLKLSEICSNFTNGGISLIVFRINGKQPTCCEQTFQKSKYILTRFKNVFLNFQILYSFGLASGMLSCAVMMLDLPGWKIYALAVGIGIAQAILLITSLSITADLINKNTVSFFFVFFFMGYLEDDLKQYKMIY